MDYVFLVVFKVLLLVTVKDEDDKTLEYNYYSSNKGPRQINPTYDTDENGNIILDSIRGDRILKPQVVQMKIIMIVIT